MSSVYTSTVTFEVSVTSRINCKVPRANMSGESGLHWGTPSEKTTFRLLVSFHLNAARRSHKNERIHRREVTGSCLCARYMSSPPRQTVKCSFQVECHQQCPHLLLQVTECSLRYIGQSNDSSGTSWSKLRLLVWYVVVFLHLSPSRSLSLSFKNVT